MSSPWHRWYEKKPVPLLEYLVDEAAHRIADALRQWPPRVEQTSDEALPVLRPLFTSLKSRPSFELFQEAFKLTQMELERHFEAYDEYMRNERWRQSGLAPQDKTTLLELNHWLLENLLTLQEATEGRLRRHQLVMILQKLQRLPLA